jgi:tetratricopeptide (TPR) repeat protein
MVSVLERLRAALAPGIAVEREIAHGGMGIVFLGRDTRLDRPLAIKVLRPELATAVAAERFLREARHAAGLQHPNVVGVHKSGEAGGLMYFTMDYVTGETLAARLERGALAPREVVRVGLDLLAALGAAHRHKVIHRDIKPSNIFLTPGRALLADFGVAYPMDATGDGLTQTGQPIGTIPYMAPEQLQEKARITERTDIYAVGLVLYEAATGQRYPARREPRKVDWSRVPRFLRRPIRRAVQLEPDERWQDVASFAAALESAESRWRVRWTAVGALVVAAVVLVGWYSRPGVPPRTYDLAVFPFGSVGLADSSMGPRVAGLTDWALSRAQQVTMAPRQTVHSTWYASRLAPAERLRRLTGPATQSRNGVWGNVSPKGDLLEVRFSVVGEDGKPVFEGAVTGSAADPAALADSVAALITRKVFSEPTKLVQVSGIRREALSELVLGDNALAREQWLTAERYYLRAFQLDSTFVLAAWRLGNVRRWMPLRTDPPYPAGLLTLLHKHAAGVPEVDRHLIEAQFKPSGASRFQQYDKAVSLGGDDANAYLLYGDELFHRGPLAGRSMWEAVDMLNRSVLADSTLAPAWEHLAWARIRLGDAERADSALRQLERWAGGPEGSEIHVPTFIRMAYTFRFGGAAVQAQINDSLSRSPELLTLAARGALSFELPAAQVALGTALAHSGVTPHARASGFIGRGVALVTLGRPAEAQASFDSAAALFPDPREARLQAAQWRVIPAALGVPGWSEEERERGRLALRAMRTDEAVGARAAWSLALDARARGDTAEAASYAESLASLLSGMDSAAQGNWDGALAASEPALALDSAGRGDPFLRAALHLERGAWLERAGLAAEADRSLLWYENLDLVGWPGAAAQAAEVDWALATYARSRRARLALAAGNRAAGCPLAESVADAWSKPEPLVAAAARDLAALAQGCAR